MGAELDGSTRTGAVLGLVAVAAVGTAGGCGAVVHPASQLSALSALVAMASLKPAAAACKFQPSARPGSLNRNECPAHRRCAAGHTGRSSHPGQSF